MVTHSYYEEDPRVRREAEALGGGRPPGRRLRAAPTGRPVDEVIDGVRVRRLGVQRHQGAGLRTYLVEYLAFLVRARFALTRAHRRRRYGLVQVHTLPDFLVFAALPLRLVGVPVILDLHEAMPEFFRSRFRGRAGRIGYALLRAQEAASIRFASAVITVNEALGDRLRRLGVRESKLTIIPNAPSLARFDGSRYPAGPFMADGTLRLVYAGALSPIYELDVVLVALARLAESRPELPVSLELYGRDFAEVPLRDLAAALGIGDRVIVPRPDPDRGRARGDRGRRRRPGPDAALGVHGLLAVDQGVRVRRHAPAGRGVAPADGRANVRRRRLHLHARRRRRPRAGAAPPRRRSGGPRQPRCRAPSSGCAGWPGNGEAPRYLALVDGLARR